MNKSVKIADNVSLDDIQIEKHNDSHSMGLLQKKTDFQNFCQNWWVFRKLIKISIQQSRTGLRFGTRQDNYITIDIRFPSSIWGVCAKKFGEMNLKIMKNA